MGTMADSSHIKVIQRNLHSQQIWNSCWSFSWSISNCSTAFNFRQPDGWEAREPLQFGRKSCGHVTIEHFNTLGCPPATNIDKFQHECFVGDAISLQQLTITGKGDSTLDVIDLPCDFHVHQSLFFRALEDLHWPTVPCCTGRKHGHTFVCASESINSHYCMSLFTLF